MNCIKAFHIWRLRRMYGRRGDLVDKKFRVGLSPREERSLDRLTMAIRERQAMIWRKP